MLGQRRDAKGKYVLDISLIIFFLSYSREGLVRFDILDAVY